MYIFPLCFLDIMEKFIIMNFHDATQKKTPKIFLNFFSLFFWCIKNILVKNNQLKSISYKYDYYLFKKCFINFLKLVLL
jgi:hypothetical protein